MYHTNIYICSNETTNSKGHTHLAALSGRKERLLEAGHCCARISVVGSSFFRLTRCERFPELCAWGVFNFREKIRFPIPPKDSSIRRRYGYYIYTKKWNNRRAEGDWRPRSQVSCWRHNPIRRLADFKVRGIPPPRRGGIARNGDVPMWHNAARPRSLQSTNVRRKDDKKGVMMTSYRSIFSQHNSPPNSSIPVSKMKTTGHLLQLDTPAVGRKDEHIRVCIRMIEVAALNGRSNDQ